MMKTIRKLVLYPLAVLLGLAGAHVAISQEPFSVPGGIFNTGELIYALDTNNLAGTPEVIATATGLKIGGTSGTEVTQITVYSQAISPASVAGGTCAEQGFTVTGVSTGDKIVYNPSGAVSPFVVGVRGEATDTVGITFCNTTSTTATPIPHTAVFIAIRS